MWPTLVVAKASNDVKGVGVELRLWLLVESGNPPAETVTFGAGAGDDRARCTAMG